VTQSTGSRATAQAEKPGLCWFADLLGCGTAKTAADLAAGEFRPELYAVCNVVCTDKIGLRASVGDWLRVRPLRPGITC